MILENHYDLANLLAASRNHPYGHTMPTDQSRQEPITRPAGSDEGFIVSEAHKCRECGSENLSWSQCNSNKTGIAEGRLRTHEVTCSFVLGCEDCSETLAVIGADKFISNYNAAQSELSALREENERLKSESFEELYNAVIDERDALREELATLKAPGPPCFCGLKQTKNPHPEAGVPPGYLEVGTVYDCIPCLNKSRHAWSKKANRLQAELTAAEQRNAELLHALRSALQGVKMVGLQDHLCDYALAGNIQAEIEAILFTKPTESGASE